MKDDINYHQKYVELKQEYEDFKKVAFIRAKAYREKLKELDKFYWIKRGWTEPPKTMDKKFQPIKYHPEILAMIPLVIYGLYLFWKLVNILEQILEKL